MRFMILRKADKDTEAGVMPGSEVLAAMGQYTEEAVKAGVMLAGEGLKPSSAGARVKLSGGKPAVIDGPFAETKELLGGFLIIDVKSKEEAIEWAKRWPSLDGRGEVELEIRQIFEASDFGPEFTPEMREAEEKMRKQAANRKRGIQIRPYLSFNGRCEEAFRFYEECLGGKIVAMLKYRDSPMAEHTATEQRDKVMHACLAVGGQMLMGADGPPNCYELPKGTCVMLGVADKAEAERIFPALAANGDVQMPLQATFWSAAFGMLRDRFGTPWMIHCEQTP